MQYANRYLFSDVEPFEVISGASAKVKKVRALSASLANGFKPEWVSGGFSAVCGNQEEQEWEFKPDLDAPVVYIRRRKDGRWYDAGGMRYVLSDKPRKYYDYNF